VRSETRGDAGLVVTGGDVLAVDADPASWETLDPGEHGKTDQQTKDVNQSHLPEDRQADSRT
jgi:hypothetical protein